MSNQQEQQNKQEQRDDLDLVFEMIKDLEPPAWNSDLIRGGSFTNQKNS